MEIRLLGVVEVSLDGHPVALGGAKQRATLAILALDVNSRVPVERLIEGLWGEQRPASAAKMVQLYVSQLRRLLDTDGAEILTRGRGYELRMPADAVDAVRFERLVGAATSADQPQRALADEALALWRGPPLDDVAHEPFAGAEIRRLEELWLQARELAIDERLAAGEHRRVSGELDELVTEHPLRERLHALRMLALYRSGRQAEALEAYRDARNVLVQEVGIEPGLELRSLHEAILQQDPAIDLRSATGEHHAPLPARTPRPTRKVMLLGALAVVAVLTAVALVHRGSQAPGPVAVPPSGVAVIDPGRNAVIAAIALNSGPGPISAARGAVWVLSVNEKTVTRIKASTRRRVATEGIGGSPGNLVAAPRDTWITQDCGVGTAGALLRIDTSEGAGTVADAEEVPLAAADVARLMKRPARQTALQSSAGCGLAADANSIWTATTVPFGLARIDVDPAVRTWHLARAAPLPFAPPAIAVGAGAVWVPDHDRNVVRQIDPDTLDPVRDIHAGDDPVAVAVGDGSLWIANYGEGTVSRIDPRSGRVTRAISVGDSPTALVVYARSVWVANSGDRSVSRIDEATNRVTATIRVGHRPQGIATAGGAVWVTVRP